MSDTEKRDAVLREFMPCGGHVCKGCEVQCINVDGRTPSVAWMADEIVRLRAKNAALTAAIERVRAACENDLRWIDAQPILRALEETP